MNLNISEKSFDYGYLVGKLETIARFNDKTDHGYTFELNSYSKKENLKKSISPSYINYCRDYELMKIENSFEFLLNSLLNNWFFEYQNQLKDTGNDFSLYHELWKVEWTEEFLKLLFETLKPINIYQVKMKELTSHYANIWEDYVFETDNNEEYHYALRLSLDD